ncbi:MAG TPA: hypothetical protein VKQ36_02195, partial [Ktedonobacterales bacterium]|nr:hypothetical protein [Ktedonobacterales bacterium]
ASLFAEAGDRTDDCVELLAYHYSKAVELSHLSAVPQPLTVETERAITFQIRAGELASHAGAFEEALIHFQNAIELAADAQKLTLYEQLGDSLPRQFKQKIREVYQRALDLWRALPERPPLTGARLIRKLLMTKLRLPQLFADPLAQEEASALWQEGVELAEQAGDEYERWRLRVASIFLTGDLLALGVEEMRQNEKVRALKQLSIEAADYFEQRQDWEALSELLDGYAGLQFRCGENSEAMATTLRRLQFTGLSFNERVDVVSSCIGGAFLSGDYDASIRMMAEALETLRPEEPLEVFATTLNAPMAALYLTGRWSETARFRQALDEIWQRTKGIEGAGESLLGSNYMLLLIALSREDQVGTTALEALLRQLVPEYREKAALPFVTFYRDGDFSQFEVSKRGLDIAGFYLMLFSEHDKRPPAELMQQGNFYADDLTLRTSHIAKALLTDDNEALAVAVDEAEAHQLIVHAAHMRIVLAKRTRDLSQLERARPVLERLEDRLFLRKLSEVEKALQAR